jgi:hypothetical protein
MASFGMVFAGAPLFMWVHAIKAAAFINNITATFYSKAGVWATPYELVHGERFPDASVVVPFGCAALILLDEDEQAKFQSRCVLMIFMHYADRHPLFTYAFYSPKTKRVVFRQDCIFLPTVFPMRNARSLAGQNPDGEQLIAYRSPDIMRDGPSTVSFLDWSERDPLPAFDDDVFGFELYSPGCFPDETTTPRPGDHPGTALIMRLLTSLLCWFLNPLLLLGREIPKRTYPNRDQWSRRQDLGDLPGCQLRGELKG